MESLRTQLLDPNSLLTKNLGQLNKSVKEALKEDKDSAFEALAEHFFSQESSSCLQTFALHTREAIKKTPNNSKFTELCSVLLEKSFWYSKDPNFLAANNALMILGDDFMFTKKEQLFIQLLFKSLIHKSVDQYLAASKIVEDFVQWTKDKCEFNLPEEIPDIISPYANILPNSMTYIATFIILNIKAITSFDVVFTFLRSLSNALSKIVSTEQIKEIYPSDSQSKLKDILEQNLTNSQYILFISIFSRIIRITECGDICFEKCKPLLADATILLDRIYGYNALSQIIVSISSLDDLAIYFTQLLMRDFDSSHNFISNILRIIFKNLMKQAKAKNIADTIASRILDVVEPLTWHSKLKTWIVPILLPYVENSAASNELFSKLFIYAQNPADSGFVSRIIRSSAKSLPTCQSLINICVDALKQCKITDSLTLLRPILEPVFDCHQELIAPTFKLLIDQQRFKQVWLHFECMLSSPRTKWPLSNDDIRSDLQYAFSCGNWDIRASSFNIYTLSNYPICDNDITLFIDNFESLMFFDSPKHIVMVEASFVEFINRINSRSQTIQQDFLNRIIDHTLDVTSRHMSPSYLSSRRQFALNIALPAIKSYPQFVKDEHLLAISSLLTDANARLVSDAKSLIEFLMKENPNHKEFLLSTKNEKIVAFFTPKVIREECSLYDEGLEAIVAHLNPEDEWDIQCHICNEVVYFLQHHSVSQPSIEAASQAIFDLLIKTRQIGVVFQGQSALEIVTRQLAPQKLREVVDKWTQKLISILDNFDMKNMRRSAALPFLALTILRLQPPDVMSSNQSIFDKLVSALVNIITSTEFPMEATNSLNVIRAILSDKLTSPLSESILPVVFVAVFNVCGRFEGWDIHAASNLCLAAIIRKLLKKNYADNTEQSLSLDQFIEKMPNARDSLLTALKSGRNHLIYLAVLVISNFKCINSDNELLQEILPHLYSRDSRMRRQAARAAISVTAAPERKILYEESLQHLKQNGFNQIHGHLMLIRELLAAGDFDSTIEFPILSELPPFAWDDYFSILNQLNLQDKITKGPLDINEFVYDQVSLFIHRNKIGQKLSVSALVALLSRVNKTNPPTDLVDILSSSIDSFSTNISLFSAALDFLRNFDVKINPELLVSLISGDYPPHILSNLIWMLQFSNPSQEQLIRLLPLFEKLVFTLGEEFTPVHISIARILTLLFCDMRGYGIALRLLVDEIPMVRTFSMLAVSKGIGVDFFSEIDLYNLVLDKLYKESPQMLVDIAKKWIDLMINREKTDSHGEPLSVLVDEFYTIKSIFSKLNIQSDIDEHPTENLLVIRHGFIERATTAIQAYSK